MSESRDWHIQMDSGYFLYMQYESIVFGEMILDILYMMQSDMRLRLSEHADDKKKHILELFFLSVLKLNSETCLLEQKKFCYFEERK